MIFLVEYEFSYKKQLLIEGECIDRFHTILRDGVVWNYEETFIKTIRSSIQIKHWNFQPPTHCIGGDMDENAFDASDSSQRALNLFRN